MGMDTCAKTIPVVHVLVGHVIIKIPGAHGHGRQPFAAFHAFAVFLRLDVLFREQVFRAAVERLVHRHVIGCRGLRFAEGCGRDVERMPVGADMLCEQHLRHLQPVFDLQPLGGYLLPAQFHAQQVIRGHEPRFDRERDLAVYLRQLPLHGFDGRKVVPERYHLPEVGVGAFAHLGCGLLQLQLRDLFAQPGEFVAADDLQPCEQGLHGRDGTQDAAFYQRQGQRPHLGDREIGLHQPVLGLEYAARGRDLREIGGECLAARLQGGVEVEAAVFERAVMLLGRGAALVERERLGQARGGGHAQQQE